MQSAPVELVDSHCHLDYPFEGKTTDQLVAEATLAGVKNLVTIGTEIETTEKIVAIADQFPNVFFTAGVHPHDTSKIKEGDLDFLKKIAAHPKCRAIGEIGLDYYYNHSEPEIQRMRLEEQLELALEVSQPIVIHSREGEADLIEALRKYAKRAPSDRVPGVIHCFTGTKEFALNCIDIGFLISVSGVITFKKSEGLRAIVRELPLDRLLVETDAPFLAPEPFRGRKCEPAMIVKTAEKLAEIHGVSLAEVASLTTSNSKKFFRIHR